MTPLAAEYGKKYEETEHTSITAITDLLQRLTPMEIYRRAMAIGRTRLGELTRSLSEKMAKNTGS